MLFMNGSKYIIMVVVVDEAVWRTAAAAAARGQTKGHDSLHISISTHVIKPHLDGDERANSSWP